MSLLSKVKFNYWSLLPVLFGTILILLLLNNSLQFDFFSFKLHHKAVHNIATYLLILSSGLFLFFSEHWRNQTPHKKLLVFSIIAFFTSIFFKPAQAFQFSIFLSLSAIYYYLKEKKLYRPNLVYISILIYFLIDIISLFWSLNKEAGLKFAGNISPLAYVPLLFCFFKLDKADFELIVHTVFRFSMLFIVLSVAGWILQGRNLQFPLHDSLTFHKYTMGVYACFDAIFSWSNYEHPTYISIIILFSLSMGWFYVFKKNIENKISFTEMSFFIFSSLLLAVISASRFMLIGWLVVNALGFLYVVRQNKKVLYTSVFILIILSATFGYISIERIRGFVNDPVRDCLHQAAYQSIKENTWHGTGLGGMLNYINVDNVIFAPLHIVKVDFTHIHPHHQFIGDLMQTGIFGLAAILFILGVLFINSFRQTDWLLLVNTVIFLLLMNIEMPLIYTKGIFAFALIFSFLANYQNKTTKGNETI